MGIGSKWEPSDRSLVYFINFTGSAYRRNVKVRILFPTAVLTVLLGYPEDVRAERQRKASKALQKHPVILIREYPMQVEGQEIAPVKVLCLLRVMNQKGQLPSSPLKHEQKVAFQLRWNAEPPQTLCTSLKRTKKHRLDFKEKKRFLVKRTAKVAKGTQRNERPPTVV